MSKLILSPEKRDDVLSALKKGSAPKTGLAELAVGLDRFEQAFDAELDRVASGRGEFKAIRGEYGTGKTFCVRWLIERAKQRGFAATEIQISENETPLHRQETVYRRAMEHLSTESTRVGALPEIIDGWFYRLEADVIEAGDIDEQDEEALDRAVSELMEKRLANVTRFTPHFSAALRGYHQARACGDFATASGLMAWIAGQPNVGASIKRAAGIKGEIDHFGAMSSLRGLLTILRDSGYNGLVLVLDEVETLQRARSDVRAKSLNALRGLIDELDAGHFPGLYVLITGTPAFFTNSLYGVASLPPLAQRLETDFLTDARFDNPRAIQIRLTGLNHEGLLTLGRRVRDIYAAGAKKPDRIRSKCDDEYVTQLVDALVGKFGGKVEATPRLFLKKLVADVLERIDEYGDFDPRKHYEFTLRRSDLTDEERAMVTDVDDIELEDLS